MLVAAFLLALQAHSPLPACTAANSEPAGIPAIHAAPDRYRHRCVAVTGLFERDALFTSRDAIYRAGFTVTGDPAELPALRQRLIVNGGLSQGAVRGPGRPATLYGRIADCEEARQTAYASEGPGEVVFVGGFCHYMSGLYLQMDAVRLGPVRPLFRLIGEAERRRVGDLTPAPATWPHRALIEAQAARYLAALRNGDRAAFAALHHNENWAPFERQAVRVAFGRHPGFAALRASRGRVSMAIFLRDEPGLRADGSGAPEPDDFSATVCFCRAGGCEDRWPISQMDADVAPGRPYVCTAVAPYYRTNGTTALVFSMDAALEGLAEPPTNGSTR